MATPTTDARPHRWTGLALVKAKLVEDGRIEAFDAVYHLTDPDGQPHRITRLAAVIHTLRHRDGWDIDTVDEPGKLAVYVLRAVPSIEPRTARIEVPMTDPDDDVPGFHGMPPEDPDQAVEAAARAGQASEARREAAAAPYCPVKDCPEKLQQVVPTLAPGWVSGRCVKHGVKTAKAA